MAYNSLAFKYFNPSQVYSLYDVVGGASATDPVFYYSTIANNLGNGPSGIFNYNITTFSRSQDIATLTFTNSGGGIPFAPGSIVSTNVGADGTANYIGMVLNGSLTTVSYLNPGWDVATTASAGTVNTTLSPAWSTGFIWVPSYSTNYENQQGVITAQFEPGYEQRMASSLNPNTDMWSLIFADRTSKEARAIRNFVQMAAGVYSFPIMITDPNFDNQPTQKFVTSANMRIQTKSFNLNDITVTVKRVFDL